MWESERRQRITDALHTGVAVPVLPKGNGPGPAPRTASGTPNAASVGNQRPSRTLNAPVARGTTSSMISTLSASSVASTSRRPPHGHRSTRRPEQRPPSPSQTGQSKRGTRVLTTVLSQPGSSREGPVPAKQSPQSSNRRADFSPNHLAVPASAGKRPQKYDRGSDRLFNPKQSDARNMQPRTSSRASAATSSIRSVSPMSHLGSPRFPIAEVQAATQHPSTVHRVQDTRPDLQFWVTSTGMVIEGTDLEMRAMKGSMMYSLNNPEQTPTDAQSHGRKRLIVPFPREIPVTPLQGYVRADGTVRSRPDSPATSVASSSGSRH